LVSSLAFIVFFGLIGIFVIPSLLIYAIVYPFVKYPQDKFQFLSSVIYKIFFKIFPTIELDMQIQKKLPQSAVYISTHQSNLDYPILGCIIKKYLIMTNLKFEKIPFISMVGHLIGVRYLDITNLSKVSKVYDEFEQMLKQDRNIIFFAEGTRNNGKKLSPFKKGAFRLSYELNKPIVPIIISGSIDILSKGNFCFNTIKNRTIKVKMLEPIYPDKYTSQSDMLKSTYQIMQEENGKLNEKKSND